VARGARLLTALLLALVFVWALGELPSYDSWVWVLPVCLLIAVVTGLPSVTGGWLMLAGLATAPLYAWVFVVAYDHPPTTTETNDSLAGFIIWLINAMAVVAGAIVIASVRTIRGDSPG